MTNKGGTKIKIKPFKPKFLGTLLSAFIFGFCCIRGQGVWLSPPAGMLIHRKDSS